MISNPFKIEATIRKVKIPAADAEPLLRNSDRPTEGKGGVGAEGPTGVHESLFH